MSINLYNKAYSSVKESVPQFKNPEDALSFYLEGASKYLAKAELAAKEERFEDRSNLSDKALMIFNGILSHLEQSPPAEKQAVHSLIEYCRVMNELIIRMNMKNDLEIAGNLTREVKKMSLHWKERSNSVATSEISPTGIPLGNEPQHVTMGNPATRMNTAPGAKTADFSA